MASIKHFLVTRFAAKVNFAVPSKHTDEKWLCERLELLQKFAIPSVAAQSSKDFTWLLLVSADAPEAPIGKLRHLIRKSFPDGRAEVVTMAGNARGASIFKHARASNAERILTTRFDSDDAVHVDFTKEIREVCQDPGRFFVQFSWGYSFDPRINSLRLFFNPTGPFVSLVEPNNDEMTSVYCGNHVLLADKGPVKTFSRERWMQVIHGGNHLNTHQGEVLSAHRRDKVLREFGLAGLIPQT